MHSILQAHNVLWSSTCNTKCNCHSGVKVLHEVNGAKLLSGHLNVMLVSFKQQMMLERFCPLSFWFKLHVWIKTEMRLGVLVQTLCFSVWVFKSLCALQFEQGISWQNRKCWVCRSSIRRGVIGFLHAEINGTHWHSSTLTERLQRPKSGCEHNEGWVLRFSSGDSGSFLFVYICVIVVPLVVILGQPSRDVHVMDLTESEHLCAVGGLEVLLCAGIQFLLRLLVWVVVFFSSNMALLRNEFHFEFISTIYILELFFFFINPLLSFWRRWSPLKHSNSQNWAFCVSEKRNHHYTSVKASKRLAVQMFFLIELSASAFYLGTAVLFVLVDKA